MALFFGTFTNKVDSKGRVSVPATFRTALEGQRIHGIVASPSLKHAAVQCAGVDWVDDLDKRISQISFLSDEHDDLTVSLLGDVSQLLFDGEGRIGLPAALATHAQLDGVAAFIGRGRFFEIWEPKALDAHKAAARKRALEKGLTLPPHPDDRK